MIFRASFIRIYSKLYVFYKHYISKNADKLGKYPNSSYYVIEKRAISDIKKQIYKAAREGKNKIYLDRSKINWISNTEYNQIHIRLLVNRLNKYFKSKGFVLKYYKYNYLDYSENDSISIYWGKML